MFHSQLIAAPDPAPFNKPRFISWPSVCDTTRRNWLTPQANDPATHSPALENHVEYACMHDPRADQPTDPRVLAACSSIDCIAAPADSSLTFTADAVQTWDPTVDIGPWTLDAGPGLPLPTEKNSNSQPRDRLSQTPNSKLRAPNSKTGRPLLFDRVKRAELCAMVRTGCSIRNAAQNAGVKMSSIYYACRTDPAFAANLRRAEKERDVRGVDRINNAGEKSWRATAWLLERASPKHFSLRGRNRTNTAKHLGPRRLKQLIAEALQDVLPRSLAAHARQPMIDAASRRINERLAEIEARGSRPFDQHDDLDDEDLDGEELGERVGVTPPIPAKTGAAASPPMNTGQRVAADAINDKPDDDPAVEAAAQAAFQRILDFLHP